MKKVLLKITALLLCVVLLCSGCSVGDIFNYLFFGYYPDMAFSEMTYKRPDLTTLETALDDCMAYAKDAKDLDTLVNKISVFFRLFSNFHTQYMLSYIHYCQDMSDSYWEKEYNYCEERTAQAEAARDQLMHALADCPFREELEKEEYLGEGCFEDYQGDSIWTEEFKALVEEESRLEARYYELSAQSMEEGYTDAFYETYGVQMEELYVSLVKLRGQIAAEAGYETYPEYAYDQYYDRDFEPEQAMTYCNDIRQELVPIYREIFETGSWEGTVSQATHGQTFGYVEKMANQMGGDILEAFEKMKRNQLYHIAPGENKYSGSFETYLYDYEEPYVFVGPTQTVRDHLSFAHEFGHFCHDYASQGAAAGIDVAEIFSQGMEYLSLSYAEAPEELVKTKMEDSLFVYVEQAAYACFEQQVYGLPAEQVTVENIRAIFERTGDAFGMNAWGFDSRMYVVIAHFFVQPMYVISYVVSNDAAMQLYLLEKKETGAGLKIYMDTLDTQQEGFMGYLEEAGLEDPFRQGRLQEIAQLFRY
jgi:oligoendopeptidase F